MNTFRALLYFDYSRFRGWLIAWWLCCLLVSVTGVSLVGSGASLLGENGTALTLSATYLIFVILVGLLFQPMHPGRPESFFRARSVAPGRVLLSRWCFAALLILLPHFLAHLVPLLLVESSFDAASAFATAYWGKHLGALALLGALAAASKKMSSYLLRSLFGGAGLLAVISGMAHFSQRESNWIFVASPEAGRLLWELGLCLLTVFIFIAITAALYLGRGSWRLAVVGILASLCLASAWQSVRFLTDVSEVGHALSDLIVDVGALSFTADREYHHGSYRVQRNRGIARSSTSGQSAPPYWNNAVEEFWFIPGQLKIEGLHPALAYSARLLEARWVSNDGEVVVYDPPMGTHSVRNQGYTEPPPTVTTDRMVELFGEPPSRPQYFNPTEAEAGMLLFGAWTSTYERFKSSPGRLELRVRVDFYRHELNQKIPLVRGADGVGTSSYGRLVNLESSALELEASLQMLTPKYRWALPIEQRWSQNFRNWWVHDPASGERAPAMGIGYSGGSPWHGLIQRTLKLSFEENGSQWFLPDLAHPESLELLHVEPHYLGTSVLDITTEGFALVTKESIEWAERDER